MAGPTCTPVNLGLGTTPEHPCTRVGVDPLSVEWCTGFDEIRLFGVLRTERNILVDLLNAYMALIKKGKAQWNPATSAAYDLTFTALEVIKAIPAEDWWQVTTNSHTPAQAASQLALMAQRVHAAACDVTAAIVAAGEPAPQAPEPPKEPQGVADAMLEFGKKSALTAGWIAAGALALGFAWTRLSGGGGGGSRRR